MNEWHMSITIDGTNILAHLSNQCNARSQSLPPTYEIIGKNKQSIIHSFIHSNQRSNQYTTYPPPSPSKSIMASNASEAIAFLSKFTCGDMVNTHQDVVTANEETTIEQALALLNKHKILSLPIFHRVQKRYVGVINLLDIATAICFQPVFEQFSEENLPQVSEAEFQKLRRLHIFKEPVVSLLGLSDESKNAPVFQAADNLKGLLNVFDHGFHRALVMFNGPNQLQPSVSASSETTPSDNTYTRMVSQTDVVRFLHANSNDLALKNMMDKPLKQLGLKHLSGEDSKKQAVCISARATALTAFQKMLLYKVPALAVVDERNRLLTTFSASDIRGTTQETFRNTVLPILDFLKITRGYPVEPVICTPEDTLRSVIESILKAKVHRAWVVNKDGQPVGVVALSDIIGVFDPYRQN